MLTLDSHIDIPWPDGPDFHAEGARRVDLPKMRRGHLGAGCFAAYVPQGPRTPEGNQAAFARAIAMLERIGAMGGAESRVCRTADEIEHAAGQGLTAIIPVVENGYATGGDPAQLARFAALGARYLTLTHNGHNDFADSSVPRTDLHDMPEEHGGLSPLGRTAIAELNRLGMLVDVSHVSGAAMRQAAAVSRTPVVATHSCVRALCDHPRNLDDEQLDLLRDTGGVIQITAVAPFLRRNTSAEKVGVADYADHVDYAVGRIGIEHVGVSSDFDGGGWLSDWRDASETPNLTAELARRGYGPGELALLWGGNFLRLLRAAEAMAE